MVGKHRLFVDDDRICEYLYENDELEYDNNDNDLRKREWQWGDFCLTFFALHPTSGRHRRAGGA